MGEIQAEAQGSSLETNGEAKEKEMLKIFWPCGEKPGQGCGREVYGGIGQVVKFKEPKHRAHNVVFCRKCARGRTR